MSSPTESDPPPLLSVSSFLPNLLTLVRLPLALLLWVQPASPTFTLSVMAGAGLSDAVDGRFARAMRRRRARQRGEDPEGDGSTAAGAWLDPACDKIFIVSAVAAVSWALRPPLGVVALIALREVGVIPLQGLYRTLWRHRLEYDFRASVVGKLATVLQFAAITSILVAPALMWPLAVACGAAGAIATAEYTYRGWQLGKAPRADDEPSPPAPSEAQGSAGSDSPAPTSSGEPSRSPSSPETAGK